MKRRFCHRIWRFLEIIGLAGLANAGIDVPLSRFCGGGTEKDGGSAEKDGGSAEKDGGSAEIVMNDGEKG